MARSRTFSTKLINEVEGLNEAVKARLVELARDQGQEEGKESVLPQNIAEGFTLYDVDDGLTAEVFDKDGNQLDVVYDDKKIYTAPADAFIIQHGELRGRQVLKVMLVTEKKQARKAPTGKARKSAPKKVAIKDLPKEFVEKYGLFNDNRAALKAQVKATMVDVPEGYEKPTEFVGSVETKKKRGNSLVIWAYDSETGNVKEAVDKIWARFSLETGESTTPKGWKVDPESLTLVNQMYADYENLGKSETKSEEKSEDKAEAKSEE